MSENAENRQIFYNIFIHNELRKVKRNPKKIEVIQINLTIPVL